MNKEERGTFNKWKVKKLTKDLKEKGKFSYFPWANAWEVMKTYDENAIVYEQEFEHYEVMSGQHQDFIVTKMLPYQKTENSSYVEVSVTVKGHRETEKLPVLDFRNQDVANPTMQQVNKALKRAFVKALAKHGLGLYIYQGEDVPSIPKITLQDYDKLIAVIDSFNEKIGSDTTTIHVERANEIIRMKNHHLDPIEDLQDLDVDQYGILLNVINKAIITYEKNEEKKKA